MNKIDMSSEAVTMRIEKLSQLRELCLELKLAGENANLSKSKDKEIINTKPNIHQK